MTTKIPIQSLTEEPKARRSDPETSHAAAASVTELNAKQKSVLSLFQSFVAMHDEALIKLYRSTSAMPQSQSGLRTRRKELARRGMIVDSGARVPTQSGRQSIVWKLA